jgi:hypothetical protein
VVGGDQDIFQETLLGGGDVREPATHAWQASCYNWTQDLVNDLHRSASGWIPQQRYQWRKRELQIG